MPKNSLLERLNGETPPPIWIYWKQKAEYGRRCRIRTASKKKGLGWIPRIFLPWKEAEDYLEIQLELQVEISGKLVPQFMSLAQTMKFIPVSLDIPDDDDTEYKKWLSDNYGDDFYEGDEEDEEEFSRLVTSADDEITLTKAQSRKLNLLRFRLGDEFGERAFLRWQANGQDAEYEDLIAHLNEWSWEEHQQIKEMQADYDIEDHVNDIKKLKLLLEDDSLGVDLEFGEYVDSYVMARVDEEYVELRQDKNGYLSKEIAGNMFLSDLEVAFDRFSLYGLSGPFDYEIIIEGHKKPLSGQEFLDEIL